jgi:hypothetical protein
MDGDGEDTPDGALQLLRAFSGATAIFAERSRRTESFVFRLFYHLYKVLHRMLTGISVRAGNFSILPSHYLVTLVVMSELWNHYAAAVFRSGLPFTTRPIPRGYRITGTSRMNFVSLTAHGISAISVFGDVVGVRLLIASMTGSLIAALGILAVTMIRIFTDQAIPGWATYSIGTPGGGSLAPGLQSQVHPAAEVCLQAHYAPKRRRRKLFSCEEQTESRKAANPAGKNSTWQTVPAVTELW